MMLLPLVFFSILLTSAVSADKSCACCLGVNRLIYQAPLNVGVYISSLVQQFTVPDVFGPEACKTVKSKAVSLGVTAVLVGSDGIDFCADSALASATAANTFALAPVTDPGTLLYNNAQLDTIVQLYDPNNYLTVTAVVEGSEILIQSALTLKSLAETAQSFALNAQAAIYAAELLEQTLLIIQKSNELINFVTYLPSPSKPAVQARQQIISQAVATAGYASTLLLEYTESIADIPYGTEYVVSRAWSLNRPIYAILNGLVSAANSLYNFEGEYRAVYLTKPLNEMTNSLNHQCCNNM